MGFNIYNCIVVLDYINNSNSHSMIDFSKWITRGSGNNCSIFLDNKSRSTQEPCSVMTDSSNQAEGIPYGKITFTIVAIVIIFLTILGNILVITAVCTERKLRKVGNSFLVNLAISDCLVGCIVMPVALLYHLHGKLLH